MPARSVLNAIALSVLLVVSILAFVIVSHVGFIGMGVIGMLMWVICNLIELDAPASVLQTADWATLVGENAVGPVMVAIGIAVGALRAFTDTPLGRK